MKKIFLFLIIAAFFAGCSKEEPLQLKAYNPDVYASSYPGGIDVQSSVQVSGFKLEESNGKYSAELNYSIDLVKPDGKDIKGLISRTVDTLLTEQTKDIELEEMFTLDSTYSYGKYKIIFNITDAKNQGRTKLEKEFEVTE